MAHLTIYISSCARVLGQLLLACINDRGLNAVTRMGNHSLYFLPP